MKYALLLFILLLPNQSRAQVKLEHVYRIPSNVAFDIVQVDSGVWRYVTYNTLDSINLYYLDHSFDRTIVIPSQSIGFILFLAKHVFDLDDQYECMLLQGGKPRVYKEDGRLLFSCDSCSIGDRWGVGLEPSPFVQTDSGTKMIVYWADRREVYSLPGKLPGCSTTLGVKNAQRTLNISTNPTSAYPNPSSGQIRIAYELPQGAVSGDLVVTSEDGREVRRFHVTSAFSDLLIDGSGLPSGSYFYRVVTANGESPSGRFIRRK